MELFDNQNGFLEIVNVLFNSAVIENSCSTPENIKFYESIGITAKNCFSEYY